MFQFLSFVIVE